MSCPSERVAVRALALVGVRFRPQGRDAATGLDCIGLAALAVGAEAVRRDYPLRGGFAGDLETGLAEVGLKKVSAPERGDVLIVSPGPAQLHVAVFTGDGIIHADAGRRRIVQRPGPIPWPMLSIWRLEEDN